MKMEIIRKEQKKIKRKKMLLDPNFRVANIIALIAFIAMIVGIIYTNTITYTEDVFGDTNKIDMQMVFVVIPFMTGFFSFLFTYFVSGAHITDMFEEALEVTEDGFVHATFEAAGAGGLQNIQGDVRKYDIVKFAEIESCKYDDVTQRIEIIAPDYELRKNGERVVSSEYVRNKLIFYDYYEPKFIDVLRDKGVSITEGRIKYEINETPPEYRGFGGNKRFLEDVKNGRAKRF